MVHVLGFVVAWKLLSVAAMPYSTALLDGHLGIGSAGIRVLGVVWLLVSFGFVGAAFGVWRRSRWALRVLAVAVPISAFLCLCEIGSAYAGLVVNCLILVSLWSARTRPISAHPA